MSNRTLLYMTGVVIIGMAIILALNVLPIFFPNQSDRYIKRSDVKGISAEQGNKLYTLNFEQQNGVIFAINQSIPFPKNKTEPKTEIINFQKIIIYRFNAPDIILTPITYENNNLIYTLSDKEGQGYLKDLSNGKLKQTISESLAP